MPNGNFFGRDSVNETGERCKILGGEKVLIVSDAFLRGLPEGPVEKVVNSLKKEDIEVIFYDGVKPNPKDTNMADGLKVFKAGNSAF